MAFSTLLLVVVIVALLVWILIGGKLKVSPEAIEVDTDGLLKYVGEALAKKQLEAVVKTSTLKAAGMQVKAISKKLPVGAILWVDDHPLNNQKEKMALARIGLFADSYTNNADALAALKTGDYNLVISDIGREADETGWDLMRSVRKNFPNVPFIVYTINITDEDRKQVTDAGAQGIVERPDELIALVVDSLPRWHR